jgi:hypothetical protein
LVKKFLFERRNNSSALEPTLQDIFEQVYLLLFVS